MAPAPIDADAARLETIRSGVELLALRTLGDREAAEEVAQETVVRVLAALREGRVRDAAKLPAFARAVARNVTTDVLRRRKRVIPLADPGRGRPTGSPDPLARAITADEARAVRSALDRLSRSDRAVLHASFYQGLSPAEIAAAAGEPSDRVRQRKSRALSRLRRLLTEAGGPAAEPAAPPDGAARASRPDTDDD